MFPFIVVNSASEITNKLFKLLTYKYENYWAVFTDFILNLIFNYNQIIKMQAIKLRIYVNEKKKLNLILLKKGKNL